MRKSNCISVLFFLALMMAFCYEAFGQPDVGAIYSGQVNSTQASDSTFDGPRRLLQQGKYDDAIAALHDFETQRPAMKGLAHEFGTAYYKKGDYVNAIAYLKKAREENPDDGEAVQLLGLSFYLSGRPADAIAPLEKVQTWFASANVDASYILGICYIQIKDYPHARGAFSKMFMVPPDSAASYLFTARMLLRQDFGPVAEEYALKEPRLKCLINTYGRGPANAIRFGIDAATALALATARRLRDIIVFFPGLIAWQWAETRIRSVRSASASGSH